MGDVGLESGEEPNLGTDGADDAEGEGDDAEEEEDEDDDEEEEETKDASKAAGTGKPKKSGRAGRWSNEEHQLFLRGCVVERARVPGLTSVCHGRMPPR